MLPERWTGLGKPQAGTNHSKLTNHQFAMTVQGGGEVEGEGDSDST